MAPSRNDNDDITEDSTVEEKSSDENTDNLATPISDEDTEEIKETSENEEISEGFSPSQSVESLTDDYFQSREDLRTVNQEIRESRENHPEFEELQKLSEQARMIRQRMKLDEQIGPLTEKASSIRERQKLLKEMIKIKLVEDGQEEIVCGKKKLKVTQELKEVKNEEKVDFEE